MKKVFWKLIGALGLAFLAPLMFADLVPLAPFLLFGAALAASKEISMSREELKALLKDAVSAREREEWEENVRKARAILGEPAGPHIFIGTGAGSPPDCSELCRTPNPKAPYNSSALKPGRAWDFHEGDYPPGSAWRKATPEEQATIATIGTAFQVQELRLAIGKEEGGKAKIVAEISRTESLISELQKRLSDLADESKKADLRIADARKPLDELLRGWPIEKQRSAIALSEVIEYERAQDKAGFRGDVKPRPLGSHRLSPGGGGDAAPAETVDQ
jgi:hypothetical protein